MLGLDLLLDGGLELVAGEVGKVVVGQELELQLIGLAGETGGVGGGDHGVGQLPDAADGVLKGTVAVDHDLHLDAALLLDAGLDGVHHGLAAAGEELELFLGGLVGAEQAVLVVVAAAVHGGGHHVGQGVDGLPGHGGQGVAGLVAGVDVAAEDLVAELGDVAAVVGEDEGGLCALSLDDLTVEVQVVHACEGVDGGAEGVDESGFLEVVHAAVTVLHISGALHEGVAHFVVGVAEEDDHLVHGAGHALEAHGEAVAAEDGEDQAQLLGGELGGDVLGDLVHGDVVALGAGHDGLGDGDDVTVFQAVIVLGLGSVDALDHDVDDVVTLPDDGALYAPGNNSCHGVIPPVI